MIGLAFLAPVCIGYIILRKVWPATEQSLALGCLQLCLGAGLGLGVTALTGWLYHLTGAQAVLSYPPVELGLLVLLSIGIGRDRLFHTISFRADVKKPAWLVAPGLAALGLGLGSFWLRSLLNPHGGWDAWAIWNLKARFLFRADMHVLPLLSTLIPWSHPDYPLLLPAVVARTWLYLGLESPSGPAAVAGVFSFAMLGLLVSALVILRGHTSGVLAGLVLVSTPLFLSNGASQLADVPLVFFLLAALILFEFADSRPAGSGSLLILAGVAVSLAAWTKNEGLAWGVALAINRFIRHARRRLWRPAGREFLLFAAGAAPLGLLLIWFKLALAPANDVVNTPMMSMTLSNLLDPQRYVLILLAVGAELLRFDHWLFWPLVLPAACLALRQLDQLRPSSQTANALVGTMGVVYGVVFLITPHDLSWHLTSALDRLMLHLWVPCIFSMALALPASQATRGMKPA